MRYNVNQYLVDTELGSVNKVKTFQVETEEDIIEYFEKEEYFLLDTYDDETKVFYADIPNAHLQEQLVVTELYR